MASFFYFLMLLIVLILLGLLRQQRTKYRRLEGRMKVLSTRLNPHFFSNSLNAIEGLINLDQKRAASKYLVHFSHLMRKLLLSSRTETTSLSKELAITKHYLAMEELRFKDRLSYQIAVAAEIDTDLVQVPSMVFQPFLEQAISERIVQHQFPSLLSLEVMWEGSQLCCIITDRRSDQQHVIPSQKPTRRRSEHHPLLAAMRHWLAREEVSVEKEDLQNEHNESFGTRILLWLPLKIFVHE